jgi:hypothetical protein
LIVRLCFTLRIANFTSKLQNNQKSYDDADCVQNATGSRDVLRMGEHATTDGVRQEALRTAVGLRVAGAGVSGNWLARKLETVY